MLGTTALSLLQHVYLTPVLRADLVAMEQSYMDRHSLRMGDFHGLAMTSSFVKKLYWKSCFTLQIFTLFNLNVTAEIIFIFEGRFFFLSDEQTFIKQSNLRIRHETSAAAGAF